MGPRFDIGFGGMLHLEEKVALCGYAASLQPGSHILEVGTSSGLTSCMLRANAPQAEVNSLDIRDKRAEQVAANPPEGVTFHLLSSMRFAQEHPEKRFELLFIDGSHTLIWAYADFLALSVLMPDDAVVAFHDYAPRFPPLQILCDALSSSGRLRHGVKSTTLFHARLDPSAPLPDANVFGAIIARHRACDEHHLAGFEERGRRGLALLRDGGMRIVGRGKRGRALAALAGADASALLDSNQARDPEMTYCICSWYDAEIFATLMNNGIDPKRVVFSDELIWYGFFLDLMQNRGDRLKAYFDVQAGMQTDGKACEWLLSLPRADLLWLCWSGILLEI
ncbi:MAG: class I SAM-dependent methyltransferase [Desulfovibrio sp.]